jgi:hypothetical protein
MPRIGEIIGIGTGLPDGFGHDGQASTVS